MENISQENKWVGRLCYDLIPRHTHSENELSSFIERIQRIGFSKEKMIEFFKKKGVNSRNYDAVVYTMINNFLKNFNFDSSDNFSPSYYVSTAIGFQINSLDELLAFFKTAFSFITYNEEDERYIKTKTLLDNFENHVKKQNVKIK